MVHDWSPDACWSKTQVFESVSLPHGAPAGESSRMTLSPAGMTGAGAVPIGAHPSADLPIASHHIAPPVCARLIAVSERSLRLARPTGTSIRRHDPGAGMGPM